MRRSLVAGAAVALVLTVLPLAARALGAPAITLQTPAADDIVTGEMSITWSYQGFSPAAWVDIEASHGGGPFQRLARVRIDDGTPGYAGSAMWATTSDDDAADYTVRVVVPSNKRVQSSAAPVVVDNTAPEATEVSRTEANEAGWNNDDVDVTWACTDAASGPVEAEVVGTAVGEGTDLTASATCTDRAGHSTTATAGGIDIDRTAPTADMLTTSADPAVPSTAMFVTIGGSTADALSFPAAVTVTFVDAMGTSTQRQGTCACGFSSAGWSVSTRGMAPGRYTVTAVAADNAGNTGASATVEFVIVPQPEVTVPPVTPPETTVPPVTVPETTVPTTTVPETTVPTTIPALPSL